MSDKFGIAIIGCGMISEFQAKAINALPDAFVPGFFDAVTEMAKRRAAEYGVKAYATMDELLADKSVHAVSICTPSGAHMEPAVQAAKAGKHVMVEKPMEVTLERVDNILLCLPGKRRHSRRHLPAPVPGAEPAAEERHR